MADNQDAALKALIKTAISSTGLGIAPRKQGKVRDIYNLKDSLVIVSTDRLSAFDRSIASIPCKGQVLNLVSKWWFEQTKDIVPNHVISVPHPNVLVAKRCTVFPIEFVVRGYLTGSSETSMWTHFSRGCRDYCGHKLSDDLKKDQKLPENIVTPTTKDDVHDELISAKEIVEQGIMSAEDWAYCEEKSLQLFRRGQEIAAKHGLLLVDTKYEFGKDAAGNIVLIDEIHTPDSSRYWLADTYEARVAEGKAPDSVDKDIVRRWIQQNCDPYKAKTLPTVPDSVIVQLSKAYIRLYELITGEKFQFADPEALSYSGLKSALSKSGLLPASKKVVIMMGSATDMEFVESGLVANLRAMDLSYEVHVSSAHKTPIQAYNILQDYEKAKFENGRAVHQVVYITVAGRSNALSGFVSANCSFPTLACPPFKDKMDMMVNIHSTLQMPSSVPAMTVLEPSNCVLAAKRMLDFIEYPL